MAVRRRAWARVAAHRRSGGVVAATEDAAGAQVAAVGLDPLPVLPTPIRSTLLPGPVEALNIPGLDHKLHLAAVAREVADLNVLHLDILELGAGEGLHERLGKLHAGSELRVRRLLAALLRIRVVGVVEVAPEDALGGAAHRLLQPRLGLGITAATAATGSNKQESQGGQDAREHTHRTSPRWRWSLGDGTVWGQASGTGLRTPAGSTTPCSASRPSP